VNTDYIEPFISDNIGKLIITGLWASEDAGILTVLFTNFNLAGAEFKLLGIKTFPVTRQENSIVVAFGGMDIDLDPESDELFTINLSEQEVESEFSRLGEERPEDLYMAVEQNAYFIGIEQNNTPSDISDDIYSFTGGGQLIEVTNNSAEIYQQAMLEVELSSSCINNPTNGFALLKKVSIQDESFPELGTAILEFHEQCDGLVQVDLATGIYITANNESIEFKFE
jgi:hypothetical protein